MKHVDEVIGDTNLSFMFVSFNKKKLRLHKQNDRSIQRNEL